MTLYDFIKENKLEMYIRYNKKTNKLEGGLFIPYFLLEDFIEITKDFLQIIGMKRTVKHCYRTRIFFFKEYYTLLSIKNVNMMKDH